MKEISRYKILLVIFAIIPILIFLSIYPLKSKSLEESIEVEANELSNSNEVWIEEIVVNGSIIDFSTLKLDDGWHIEKNGMLCAYGSQNSLLTIPVKQMKNVNITFLRHSWSGVVALRYNGETDVIDLFSDDTENDKTTKTLKGQNVVENNNGYSLFSMKFLLCLMILYVIYFIIGRKYPSKQWCILLIGSYLFYASTGIKMLGSILITTVTTWLGAIFIQKVTDVYKDNIKDKKTNDKKEIETFAI